MTRATVSLYCAALKRWVTKPFYDSHGIAVGNTYFLDENAESPKQTGSYQWEIRKIIEEET